jgi:hypothetical protein
MGRRVPSHINNKKLQSQLYLTIPKREVRLKFYSTICQGNSGAVKHKKLFYSTKNICYYGAVKLKN